MYTRSYPSRRSDSGRALPPDYSGTALVVQAPPQSTEEHSRQALTNGRANPISDNGKQQARRILFKDDKEKRNEPSFPPPFGLFGQENASASRRSDTAEAVDEAEKESSPVAALFDPSNLKSDDLLLLGLALLLFTDGENNNGDIPIDALLILAMLYLSGL